ncbi:MAG: DUF421 domain-containing protein [Longimicrobiaceae bacterium]
MSDWFLAPPQTLLWILLTAVCVYAALLLYTRLAGLRSFAKMSSFDFAMTVAVGSVVAGSILSENPALVQSLTALAAIFGLQFGLGTLRQRFPWVQNLVDNEPILLMWGEEMLRDNLREARVSEDDLWSKLREANVLHPGQIRAVVMETTGDVTVLHGDADGPELDPRLLTGVRDVDRYFEVAIDQRPAAPGVA